MNSYNMLQKYTFKFGFVQYIPQNTPFAYKHSNILCI